MLRIGSAPYYECSSRGDRRFSAFSAQVRGKSIEQRYQAAKIIGGRSGFTWREVKGKQAENMEEVRELYESLWREYISDNPDLLALLKEKSGLSDVFGQAGRQCQAVTLWKIRGEG